MLTINKYTILSIYSYCHLGYKFYNAFGERRHLPSGGGGCQLL